MTWLRSDLESIGLGRALVIRVPRVALTYWRSDGTYTITGPATGHTGPVLQASDATTTPGMSLAAVLDWCADHGIPKPSTGDLAWVEYR